MTLLAPIDLQGQFEKKGRRPGSFHDLLYLPMQYISSEKDGQQSRPLFRLNFHTLRSSSFCAVFFR